MSEQPASTIAELLWEQARARPAAPAILAPGRAALTFTGLWQQASELATALQSLGVTPSTRVAVVLPNGPEMAVVFLGTSMCSTCAPLNPAYSAAELRFYLEDLGAKMLIVQAGDAGPAGAVARELGLNVLEVGTDTAQPAGHLRIAVPNAVEAVPSAVMACADDIALILHTSGTTARPKIVPLTQANLVASAHNIARHLALQPADRCLNVMPLFHIHGLVGALLSTMASGGSIVCAPGFDAHLFFDWTAQFDPTWYSAVPTIHQSVLENGAEYRLKAPQHRFRFVRSSSAALAPAVFHRLQELTGAPVVEAYGMTEASHQMTSNPLPPGVRKPGSVGVAAGVDVALMNEGGDLLTPGETGEIVIRGPGVFAGYENHPQANASSFTHGWFRTGDQGRLDDEGYLFISGRLKEIVNRAGEKISPREVDEALLEHPEVAQATAFGMPHPTLGEDLAAAVVLRSGAQAEEAALRAFLFKRLAAFKVPSVIAFVDVIPKGPTGKVQRNSLHEKLRDQMGATFVDARTDLERSIQAIFREVLGGGTVGMNDNFFAAGGDSLTATRVISRINERHGLALAATEVFHHPTVATLAAAATRAIAHLPARRSEPLSASQEALWFLEQLHGPSGVYNIAYALRLVGSLDVAVLERSLQGLLERHDSLSTGFAEQDGVPLQFVAPQAALRLPVLGVSSQADEDRLLIDGAGQAFDLLRAPLFRAQLLRRSDTEHVLQLVAHHIVSDGWSTDLMIRELGVRYTAGLEGSVPTLPTLAARYDDHVRRQRQRLQGAHLERHLQYWRTRLHGLEPLKLPPDQPQPDRISQHGSVATLVINGDLYAALQALASAHKSTLFTVLAAAFNVQLGRCGARDDVAVGMPIAGRAGPEVEDVVGFFVNTVVLRTDLSGNPSFLAVLQRVRQGVLDAIEHQDLPFARLVGELGSPRDLGSNPLFDVFINQYGLADAVTNFPGLVATEVALKEEQAKFAATLYLHPRAHELLMRLVFRRGLYTEAWGACLLQQYVALLDQIVLAPQKPIAEYSLLTDATRSQLPDPTVEIPAPEQVPVMCQVLDRAQATPHGIAVNCGKRQWTYAELVTRASALSSTLQSHGVERGDVVAIVAPRGLEVVGSMLAVLLCGGVLLTVDPALPRERQRVLLREARVKVLCLAQGIDAPETGDGDERMGVIRLDPGLESAARADAHAGVVLPMPAGDEPAYVFFTSGSTGRPKAVLGCHKSLSQFLQWQQQTFDIGPQDRVSQLTSLSFDPLLRDVFLPLISGATLCVPLEHDTVDALRWLQRERVTVVHTTPSVLQAWLADLHSPLDLPDLRWIFLAGEPLLGSLVTRWRQCVQSAGRIVNLYGPTETTMARCFHVVADGDVPAVLPVGRPTANAQALVMSMAGALCGANEPGEVVLRTPFRTLGYLNLPEDNRARFRLNPFRDDPVDLLYFTGDRGHLRPDGLLMIAGRLDDQVKIRGVRVEPGEVAAVLAQHPSVQACVVTARKNDTGEFELVAHVVKSALGLPTAAQLRDHLRDHLPAALVPVWYVFLDAMPLLPNGKVDRRALPRPDSAEQPTGTAPRTPLEHTLSDIWRELLGVPQFGIDDDFFDLGGHSLLAMRVVSRIQSTLNLRITVRTLFESPTVARLCAAITQAHPIWLDAQVPVASIDAGTLSCAQEGLWFFEGMTGPSSTYNIARAMRLFGPLNVSALERAVHALVQRHDSLRTAFLSSDGVAVQSVRPLDEVTGKLQLSAMALEGCTLAEALRAAAAEPFDLACAPLLRVRLWRTAENEHALLLVVHHIVSDGWSMGILARELGALYGAFDAGQPDPLAPLPRQFTDYAVWQRQRLNEPGGTRDLAYWRAQLAGLEPLQLHTDRARPPRSNHQGASERFEISPATLAELKALARRENATLFMVLLAAFQVLLMRHSGQHDVAVGTPVAGRHRTEFEGLIGYFVNTIVLRSDLSGNPSFLALLARVRQTCLQAYEHQEQPFDRLVAELGVERDLGRNPLYQVAFVLHNTPSGTLELGDLRSEPLAVDSATAKFDLSLSLGDEGDALRGSLEYSTQLFDAATIERVVSHFGTLLEAIAAQPHQSIEQLPLMNRHERELLLGWSGSTHVEPEQPNLQQLFEAQVRRHPDAFAVVMGNSSLSYAGLNARANRLAHQLRSLGVAPDVLVGVCMRRSPDLIVVLLAIVKAGGAYVPLDPEYPSERLAFMLADTAAPVLITEQALRGQLPASSAHVLCIGGDTQDFAHHPDGNPSALASVDNLAYVIYTSGSTGSPKGVMVSHRAVARLVVNTDYVQLGSDDVVAQASNSSFDAATFEIWGALLNGAKLVVVSKDVLLSGAALAREIAAHRITTLFLTTSVFNEHAANSPGMFSPLKQLLFGGEAVDPAAVRRVLDIAPPGRLINGYGPTETTTFATWFEAPLTSAEVGARVPIGRPIANTRCRVLDARLEPVPVGIVGELYIGGPGLARGYLNRPELTAERFVDDPWLSGERLYRTGDLVRYRPDGSLDCVGRADRQVKLRGFRIELGEIEAALVACAGVRQAVVQLGTDSSGTGTLVAYVVSPGGTADTGALVAELKKRLPDHMIPCAIVALPALPLTPNGKLDHKALPRSGFGQARAHQDGRSSDSTCATGRAAPQTPLERALAATWSEVLGVQDIGVHDDFFQLGGHSLLAVRLLHAIDKALGSAPHITTLFQAPTIHQLAARIEQQQLVPSSCVVAMQPRGERKALFAIAGYGGGVRRFRTLAAVLLANQPLYLLDTALFSQETKDFSLEDMAARMIVDMREQQPEGPYHLIGYSLGGNIAFEMARQLRAAGVEVGLLALLDSMSGDAQPAPFLTRVWRHFQHGLALGPRGAARYLGQRAWRLRKYVISLWPQLFGGMPITLTPIEDQVLASRYAVAWAWLRYRPGLYPGSMLLVRAAARSEPLKNVNGNDPELGWGALVGGRLCLESMNCNHQELIDPEHAGELASILHKHLELLEASQQPDVEHAPRA